MLHSSFPSWICLSRVLYFYQIQIPLQRQQLRRLLADSRTKSVSSRLGQTRRLPCEVSFHKIRPGKWPRNSPPLLRKISRMGCLCLPKWYPCTWVWERYGPGQWNECNHMGLHGQSIMIAVGWQICKDILGGNPIWKGALQKMWPKGWNLEARGPEKQLLAKKPDWYGANFESTLSAEFHKISYSHKHIEISYLQNI